MKQRPGTLTKMMWMKKTSEEGVMFFSKRLSSAFSIGSKYACFILLIVLTTTFCSQITKENYNFKIQNGSTGEIESEKYIHNTKTKSLLKNNSNLKIIDFFKGQKNYKFPLIKVAHSSENLFSTPISWFNGNLYVVDIEPPDGENNGINLKTVVRKWAYGGNGIWRCESKVIERRTIDDRYHTQASLAVDKNGFIHIAYNMHNMPWQYKISKYPEDISEFVFHGESVTNKMLSIVKHENKTPFANIGNSAIPGNQITYPAFFVDRNHDLYITYRFATRPGRTWKERGFAGGIAKYDTDSRVWMPIGGSLEIKRADAIFPKDAAGDSFEVFPFAYQGNWTVYLIRLHFDMSNVMHASWTWREGGAGRDCSHPSYASSYNPLSSKFKKSNGDPYNMPINLNTSDIISNYPNNKKFYAMTSISTDQKGQPHVILNPIESFSILVYYDRSKESWSEPQKTPFGASEIYIDESGKQWVFASGINVFTRSGDTKKWRQVYADSGYKRLKILYVSELKGFFIHCFTSDYRYSRIIWIRS